MSEGQRRDQDALGVFISYSRQDSAAADVLVEALIARGFRVTIDRRDLPFGEKWQAELADFIRNSDTVVWLVSPASISSKVVNWELDEVAKRHKRLVPVMLFDMPREELPRQLGEIHVLPATGKFEVQRDFDTLVDVLHTDRGWLKQASRLQDRAGEWLAKARTPALLLSRGALADAEAWKDRRPLKAPVPSPEVLDLMLASGQAAKRRLRWWVGGSLTVALGTMALAAVAYLQSLEADRQRGVAEQQTQVADTQRRTADRVRLEAQTTESGLLANSARAISDRPFGDAQQAMLVALEGLPDQASDDIRQRERPIVSAPRVELHRALGAVRETAWLAHDNKVVSLAYSPDGQRLATGSLAGTARLFEGGSNKEIARLPNDGPINEVAFSPDGKYLVTASHDGTARVFDAQTGQQIARFAHDSDVVQLAFSLDGRSLATAARGGTVHVFDLPSRTETAKFTPGGQVTGVAISADGQRLATASDETLVLILDLASRKEIARIVHNDADGQVHTIVFDATGSLLVSASEDKTARLIDVTKRKEVARLPHSSAVRAVAFSPDGRTLATGSGVVEGPTGAARLFDVATRQEMANFDFDGAVVALSFSPDGKQLAAGSGDFGDRRGEARLFETSGKTEPWRLPHKAQVNAVVFSSDGARFATASGGQSPGGGLLRVFTGRRETASLPHGGGVWDVAFSQDGRSLATASENGTARLIDAATGREIASYSHGAERVTNVTFSPDGKWLATQSWDDTAQSGKLRLIELATGKVTTFAHDGWVLVARFSPDSRFIATGSADKTARLIETTSGSERARLMHGARVMMVGFSADSAHLVAVSEDGTARLVDTATAQEAPWFAPHGAGAMHAAFSRAGSILAIASTDKTVRLIDVGQAREVAHILHDAPPGLPVFSPDGRSLATAASDGDKGISEVRLSVAGTGGERARITVDKAVGELAFSADGRLLLTRAGERVQIFDAATGEEIAKLDHDDHVDRLAINPKDASVLTATSNDIVSLWHVYPTTQALVDAGKERAAKCLTRAQRDALFLPAAPPTWCIARRLWPYQADAWQGWLPRRQAWLAAGREGAEPPLPDERAGRVSPERPREE